MNLNEHLLTCLAEEGGEVAHDCHKSLRFGLDDVNVLTPNGPTNRERLIVEINQFIAVVDMLVQYRILPTDWQSEKVKDEKRTKVHEFMAYAQKVGALQK